MSFGSLRRARRLSTPVRMVLFPVEEAAPQQPIGLEEAAPPGQRIDLELGGDALSLMIARMCRGVVRGVGLGGRLHIPAAFGATGSPRWHGEFYATRDHLTRASAIRSRDPPAVAQELPRSS